MTAFTLDEITALRGVVEAATSGPWHVFSSDSGHSQYELSVRVATESHGDFICDMDPLSRATFKEGPGPDDDGSADAALIVAAVNALPGLLDALEEAREANQKWATDYMRLAHETGGEVLKLGAERDAALAEVERLTWRPRSADERGAEVVWWKLKDAEAEVQRLRDGIEGLAAIMHGSAMDGRLAVTCSSVRDELRALLANGDPE